MPGRSWSDPGGSGALALVFHVGALDGWLLATQALPDGHGLVGALGQAEESTSSSGHRGEVNLHSSST